MWILKARRSRTRLRGCGYISFSICEVDVEIKVIQFLGGYNEIRSTRTGNGYRENLHVRNVHWKRIQGDTAVEYRGGAVAPVEFERQDGGARNIVSQSDCFEATHTCHWGIIIAIIEDVGMDQGLIERGGNRSKSFVQGHREPSNKLSSYIIPALIGEGDRSLMMQIESSIAAIADAGECEETGAIGRSVRIRSVVGEMIVCLCKSPDPCGTMPDSL